MNRISPLSALIYVCQHWRTAVINTPELWLFVDISRGLKLTELWLSNSTDTRFSIRLSEPFHDDERDLTQTARTTINIVQKQAARWRSLDIPFSCICRTHGALVMLWQLPDTMLLDSLMIGPMGRTAFTFEDETTVDNLDVAYMLFRKINVAPASFVSTPILSALNSKYFWYT
jgi:hypothetical protein